MPQKGYGKKSGYDCRWDVLTEKTMIAGMWTDIDGEEEGGVHDEEDANFICLAYDLLPRALEELNQRRELPIKIRRYIDELYFLAREKDLLAAEELVSLIEDMITSLMVPLHIDTKEQEECE